jgi:hypothetical protein
MSCTNSTRCSAIAAAVWRSPTPRLPNAGPRHLRGRRRGGEIDRRAGGPGNHGAAGRPSRGARFRQGADRCRRPEVIGEAGVDIPISVGTMIELPRAAIRAHAIAEVAEFFSFGTNDLTQTTFGISRDDASSFLMTYEQKGIIEQDPFVTLDIDGVGELVRIASERAGQPGPTSSWASAASTAATRPRSSSAKPSVSTMSAARRSACRSPGWPRRRRRSRKPALPEPGAKTDPKTGPKRRQSVTGDSGSNIPEFRRRINQSWRPGCKSGPSHRSRWIVFCRYISWRLKQWTSSL